MTEGPLGLLERVAAILDDLGIPYALGGSLASSFIGEPRSTVDIDVAIDVSPAVVDGLLDRVSAEFYVPRAAAASAVAARSSFNLVDTVHGLKADLFVLGDGLLDRRQIERRVFVTVPGIDRAIAVTSAEDQVLRKLDWYRKGDGVSERQWRDVLGILRVHGDAMDLEDLQAAAESLGLGALLAEARAAVPR